MHTLFLCFFFLLFVFFGLLTINFNRISVPIENEKETSKPVSLQEDNVEKSYIENAEFSIVVPNIEQMFTSVRAFSLQAGARSCGKMSNKE